MNRREMAQQIVDWEAWRDDHDRLVVYPLPSNDGGGTYEVAGINERYHPAVAAKLKKLIEAGQADVAEVLAVEHIASYTDVVKPWQNEPAVEFFLRDCAFNRGPGGAAKILQIAVGTNSDGNIGPKTKAAIRLLRNRVALFLYRLRVARERYEEKVAPNRPNLRKGLEARWDNAFEAAIAVWLSVSNSSLLTPNAPRAVS